MKGLIGRSFEVVPTTNSEVWDLILFEEDEEVGGGRGSFQEMWDAGAEWNGWVTV